MSYTTREKIKIRLRQFDTVNESGVEKIVFNKPEENFIIDELIDKAKKDIIEYRHYPNSYDDEMIAEDIEKNYSNMIIDLVLYDYTLEGADFERNHSENNVNRTYIDRNSILGKVVPFIKILL